MNAFSTQVTAPPFLYQLPFIEAMTTGSRGRRAADRRALRAARGSGVARDQTGGGTPLQEFTRERVTDAPQYPGFWVMPGATSISLGLRNRE